MKLTIKEIKALVEVLESGFPMEQRKRNLLAKIWARMEDEIERDKKTNK